jgi:hypothetical protein
MRQMRPSRRSAVSQVPINCTGVPPLLAETAPETNIMSTLRRIPFDSHPARRRNARHNRQPWRR